MARPLYRDFTTVAELDTEYAIHQSVPIEEYREEYTLRSAETRQKSGWRGGLRYGPTSAEKFDFFPAYGIRRPVVVFLHGGYWYTGAREEWSFVADHLVTQGVSVVVSDYALCPNVTMGEIVRQHRALVTHLLRNADALDIDPTRVVLVGHSAGAHGVMEVLATTWSDYELPDTVVCGAVGISGVYDLRPLPYTFVAPHLQLGASEALALSPVLSPPEADARVLIVHGTRESAEFQRQSIDFADACRSAGTKVEELVLERNHYDIVKELSDPGGLIGEWILQLVD
ncbi:alpha/beta hydrolase [Rhodococcus sp. NPDC055024]